MPSTFRAPALRRAAWACVLLMLAVTVASAWLRLAAPRPACADWPGCRDGARPALSVAAAAAPAAMTVTRGVHRVAATSALLVVVALVVLTLRRAPYRRGAAADALALLALALALSVLGVVTPGSRAAGVLLGNQLGGLLMLALAWRLLRRVQEPHPTALAVRAASFAGLLLWLLQAAWGGLAGARLVDGSAVVHVALAILALPLAATAGWLAYRHRRRAEGVALIVVTAAQGLLGATAAAGAAAPGWVWIHGTGAALGAALLAGLTVPGGRRSGS